MSNATEKGHYFKGQYIQISIEKKSQNNIPQEIIANLFIHRKKSILTKTGNITYSPDG